MAQQHVEPIVDNNSGGLLPLEGPYCAICHYPGVDVCFTGCSCQVHAVRGEDPSRFSSLLSRFVYKSCPKFRVGARRLRLEELHHEDLFVLLTAVFLANKEDVL